MSVLLECRVPRLGCSAKIRRHDVSVVQFAARAECAVLRRVRLSTGTQPARRSGQRIAQPGADRRARPRCPGDPAVAIQAESITEPIGATGVVGGRRARRSQAGDGGAGQVARAARGAGGAVSDVWRRDRKGDGQGPGRALPLGRRPRTRRGMRAERRPLHRPRDHRRDRRRKASLVHRRCERASALRSPTGAAGIARAWDRRRGIDGEWDRPRSIDR